MKKVLYYLVQSFFRKLLFDLAVFRCAKDIAAARSCFTRQKSGQKTSLLPADHAVGDSCENER
jgi:hypothetical protein